jgi:glycosyltransferase involved in cell wall biosynthesis
MAAGRPVIAYGRGGVRDTVIDGCTGLLFREQSVEGLIDAVERFEASGLEQADPALMVRHARRFDEATFRAGIEALLSRNGMGMSGRVEL